MRPVPDFPLRSVAVRVITVSDRAFTRERPDATGPLLAAELASVGADATRTIVPDDVAAITQELVAAIDSGAQVVVTTGGTGIGPRDVTPEATRPLIDRELPGIPEVIRQRDSARVPSVALSRGVAGLTTGDHPVLLINLPGSPRAVSSTLDLLPGLIAHAIDQLNGRDH